MKIISNELEGKYAVPNHPITTLNPAPWKITEMKIENVWDSSVCRCVWKFWIRNEKSMWFRLDQCFVNTKEECEEALKLPREAFVRLVGRW